MAARDNVADLPGKDLVIERVFDAPRERVFDVFTKPEHLQKWWGPKMVGISVAEFDARPGGKIFISERHREGGVLYLAGVVREIERPSRLVFAIHFANQKRERVSPPAGSSLGAAWDGDIVSIVMFSAEGRRTRVTIRTPRSGVTAEWSEKARYGWGESLDKVGYAIADDMTVAPAGEREIVITRTFNAPRALVYETLTSPGRYRYAQQGPNGEVAFSREIRESSPGRMIYTEESEAMPGHAAVVTVTLDEREGKTVMMLRSVYQSKEDRDAVMASGMESGARLSYLQLDELIDSPGRAA